MNEIIHPSILYFGTPVVLVSTLNENGSANLAPISSAWWLGWNAVLGFGAHSKTPQNLQRTRQCVLNLPSVDEVRNVDRLALLTGSNPVPPHRSKRAMPIIPTNSPPLDSLPSRPNWSPHLA